MTWLLKLYPHRPAGRRRAAAISVARMFPGVLAVGMQSMYLRGHSTLAKVVLIGGPFLVLFLIGLLTGLAQSA